MATQLSVHRPFGKTGLSIPVVTFGTSCLGNLYHVVPDETKLAIVAEALQQSTKPVWFDSAGKYGAGLALEVLGKSLRRLAATRSNVIVSNKLGWYRTNLNTPEPTFEPGVWAGIQYDAESRISYDGILQCHEQGCELLGPSHTPQVVSVHDPDEFLAASTGPYDRDRRLEQVLGAYRALFELKAKGLVCAVGIGAKDWRVIREIAEVVDLDWVMFACSLTVYSHPRELLDFIAHLNSRQVGMINSAVFNAGFLIGGEWFNYRRPDLSRDAHLFLWRDRFLAICHQFAIPPSHVCVQFGLAVPGIVSVALNTERPDRIRPNMESASADIPPALWRALKDQKLVSRDFPIGN